MTKSAEPKPPPSCGVLVVDKPAGCTSHDVVGWARRVFATREVGHAGTLDPGATGVLVVLIGEATKLSNWVTSEDKSYECELCWGAETDTLDADGTVTRTTDAATPDADAIEREARAMLGAQQQIPPAVSAIKVGGVAAHERVRRGESVELAAREVELRSVRLLECSGDRARFELEVSKGFYVRSFARDLAARLSTLAHLTALRRTRSGVFSVEEAVDGARLREARADEALRPAIRGSLITLASLEGRMPTQRVASDVAERLLQGKRVDAPAAMGEGVHLILAERSEWALPPQPIGLARRVEQSVVVVRNLVPGRVSSERLPWLDGAQSALASTEDAAR
ncbi:MAG: tRNA pseudouridine(55) synthase TruB [Polyangiales bacterium]